MNIYIYQQKNNQRTYLKNKWNAYHLNELFNRYKIWWYLLAERVLEMKSYSFSHIKLLTEGIQELKGLKELMERLEGEPQAIDI